MKSTAVVVLLAWLLPGLACAERVTLAAEDDWAPYSVIGQDGSSPEGFAVDLVRAAFATQGVEVDFLTVPFSRCLFYAQGTRAVGCFDVTITEANREQYIWHPTPLFEEGLAIFGRADDPHTGMGAKDLAGKLVGITNGYTYPTSFMEDPAIRRHSANSDSQLLQMLVAGRLDYILLNTMPGYMRIEQDPHLRGKVKLTGVLQTDGFWVAFSKAHPDGARMARLFEKGLQALHKNGRYASMTAEFRKRYGQ
ncbi:substrate-binding periplasmic protein [Pseudomonas tohonis]|uniref:Transporter n=1 Tax=Pseudomonas tohonis TaxID=2725477 RepID=A0ABQ4VYT6_9PSED|nr:transporter substrate-binding domain-containing protein [Pseudomonas tohonis]GJN52357.1 transporter [Pseudomonas tohonis]